MITLGLTKIEAFDLYEKKIAPFLVKQKNGCWEFTGGCIDGGYGCVRHGKLAFLVHRVAYIVYVGEITEGLLICHRCDNPPCCNPEHLFLGTHVDNGQDAAWKGRFGQLGEMNKNAKLTNNQVLEIRKRLEQGEKGQWLAREFGVSKSCISAVKCLVNWIGV